MSEVLDEALEKLWFCAVSGAAQVLARSRPVDQKLTWISLTAIAVWSSRSRRTRSLTISAIAALTARSRPLTNSLNPAIAACWRDRGVSRPGAVN